MNIEIIGRFSFVKDAQLDFSFSRAVFIKYVNNYVVSISECVHTLRLLIRTVLGTGQK